MERSVGDLLGVCISQELPREGGKGIRVRVNWSCGPKVVCCGVVTSPRAT